MGITIWWLIFNNYPSFICLKFTLFRPWSPDPTKCSIYSLIVYLNDEDSEPISFLGGETNFVEDDGDHVSQKERKILCSVKPKQGSALIFKHEVGLSFYFTFSLPIPFLFTDLPSFELIFILLTSLLDFISFFNFWFVRYYMRQVVWYLGLNTFLELKLSLNGIFLSSFFRSRIIFLSFFSFYSSDLWL